MKIRYYVKVRETVEHHYSIEAESLAEVRKDFEHRVLADYDGPTYEPVERLITNITTVPPEEWGE